jgi:DNA-3-methyladenine glycosylase
MQALENALPREFFARHTPDVARDLIGAILCRRLPDGNILHGRIIETEAYRDNEPACHAARGPTPRCKVMFGEPGIAYVYFIYGNYHCLNVVTEPEGSGCAVLIRAVEGDNLNGPGKLCREWLIDKGHNGLDLTDGNGESDLWIAAPAVVPAKREIGVSSRIGIKEALHLQWRYFLKDHPGVSGPKAYNRPRKSVAVR